MDVGSAGSKRAAVPQRRYVSILFADIVDSTEISDQLEAEDLGVLMTRYQRLALATMERYGGFVARFSGDGVLCILATLWPTRTMGSAPYAPDWNSSNVLGVWTVLSANSCCRSLQSGSAFTPASLSLRRRWGAPAGSTTVLLGIR